jgi:hypothetical protein
VPEVEDDEACDQCGHASGPHLLMGYHTAPEFTKGVEIPIAGWRICPECPCWATWSIAHGEMPPGMLAVIDLALAEVRDRHAQGEI